MSNSLLPNTPSVRSAVNGMTVPLHPHQGGILHRFNQKENKLVIAGVSGEPKEADPEKLVLAGTVDPALAEALKQNAELREMVVAQGDTLAEMRQYMSDLKVAKLAGTEPPQVPAAAPQVPAGDAATAKPARVSRKKAEADANTAAPMPAIPALDPAAAAAAVAGDLPPMTL